MSNLRHTVQYCFHGFCLEAVWKVWPLYVCVCLCACENPSTVNWWAWHIPAGQLTNRHWYLCPPEEEEGGGGTQQKHIDGREFSSHNETFFLKSQVSCSGGCSDGSKGGSQSDNSRCVLFACVSVPSRITFAVLPLTVHPAASFLMIFFLQRGHFKSNCGENSVEGATAAEKQEGH